MSAKSSSSPTMTPSSLLLPTGPVSSVLGDGEASEPGDRSFATRSSSKANQLEFVKREPLQNAWIRSVGEQRLRESVTESVQKYPKQYM